MCTYKYISGPNSPNIVTCRYSDIYNQISNTSSHKKYLLPHDADGKCIFHSQDIAWKRANNFSNKFDELIEIINNTDSIKFFDFRGFIFVSDTSDVITMEGLTFDKDVNFSNSVFVNNTRIEKNEFRKDLNMNFSKFDRELQFNNNNIAQCNFSETKFYGNAHFCSTNCNGFIFQKAIFTNNVSFDNIIASFTIFSEITASKKFSIKKSKFQQLVDFSDSKFIPDNIYLDFVNFSDIEFYDVVDFSKVKFSNLLTFDNVIFHDRINFIDTVFSVKSHTNYRGASVNFKKISVEEGAILEFRSTDKQNKIFQNDVLFSNETIKGQILFENVNFNRILKEGRARLLKLQNNYNVIIGKGCLKYRHQTKPKTLFVNSNNHALIAEIAETFANFFCEHNGLNLGFEIIEKDDNKITFFYFSDENITATQFNERLTKTEFDLWTMINNPEVVYNKHENNTNSPNISPDQSNEAVFINGFLYANELMINLMGMFFKISARIKHGKIGLDDLDSIFNSIHFGDRKLEIDSKIVYQTIINNYDQRRLISINKNNNIKVIGDNNAVLQDTTKSSIDITKYH